MKKLTRDRVVPIISASVLTKRNVDRRGAAFLAEIRKQQEQARQPSFAGIEQLIDQIVFDTDVARQKIGDEKGGKPGFGAKRRLHRGFCDRSNQAFFHRMARRCADSRTIEAGFPEELPFGENGDDRFLAVLGQYRDLDLAVLDEKHGVGDVALAENLLVFRVPFDRLSRPCPAKKSPGIKDPIRSLD